MLPSLHLLSVLYTELTLLNGEDNATVVLQQQAAESAKPK